MLKYYNELLYFAQKLVGNKDAAKDLVQEAYSRVLKKDGQKKIHNERAYLYKITKNLVVDEAIKNQQLAPTMYEENMHFSPKSEQPEEILIQEDQEEVLMRIIEKLPQRASQAFILHTIDGYSRKEIAQIMGVTSNAVEKLIKRASLKIEAELQKKGL
jgi:RNA polymerase sigma-70 factor (ECF subfamily)